MRWSGWEKSNNLTTLKVEIADFHPPGALRRRVGEPSSRSPLLAAVVVRCEAPNHGHPHFGHFGSPGGIMELQRGHSTKPGDPSAAAWVACDSPLSPQAGL
jgi:hypothetical protein